MIMRKLILASMAILFIACASCNKDDDPKEGCTDPAAKNYDANAEIDKGNCIYETSLEFWYTEASRQKLIDDQVETLKFYFNDVIAGSNNQFILASAAETCGHNGNIGIDVDITGGTQAALSYRVTDHLDNTLVEGDTILTANQCMLIEVVY